MVDIYGTLDETKTKQKPGEDLLKQVKKKKISDEIFDLLNLANVDPGEFVIFQNREGKLITSNISISDIIVRNRATGEGLVAIYDREGKLVPSAVIPLSIRNSISERLLKTGNTMMDPLT